MHDLVVTGGTVITPNGPTDATIVVNDGKISELLAPLVPAEAKETLDARGLYVLPGMVDNHVHFRSPGLEHKEDWLSGSRAAVKGGVTTVIDMPNTVPPLVEPEKAADKARSIAGNSLVDFGFHLGVDPRNLKALSRIDKGEIATAKVFLAGHHTAPNVVRDEDTLREVFKVAAKRGIRLIFHAESQYVFDLLDKANGTLTSDLRYEATRPKSAGIVAVVLLLRLVEEYGVPVHILHVSSHEEVVLLSAARQIGLPVSFEVTPHHLAFSDHDTIRLGSRIKLSPAIREPMDRDSLWQAVMSETCLSLGSDHAPHTLEEKLHTPEATPPGMPGVQELLVTVFSGLRRRSAQPTGELLALLSRLYATNPADMVGLKHKGRLLKGCDADLVLFDAEANWMMTNQDVAAKCGWSAYEGWDLDGRVMKTLRRGKVAYDFSTNAYGKPTGQWTTPSGKAGRPPEPEAPGQVATAK